MPEALMVFLATLGYGALHSLLAGRRVKDAVRQKVGPAADRFYRLGYNAVALLTLIPWLAVLIMNIGPVLVRVPGPGWIVMAVGQGVFLLLLAVSFLQSDPSGLLGLRQLGNTKGDAKLVITGAYSIVRHPMYTTGLLILWLFPILTTGTLAFDLGITLYILAGSELEERKLVVEYGEEYKKYKTKVARLIPFIY